MSGNSLRWHRLALPAWLLILAVFLVVGLVSCDRKTEVRPRSGPTDTPRAAAARPAATTPAVPSPVESAPASAPFALDPQTARDATRLKARLRQVEKDKLALHRTIGELKSEARRENREIAALDADAKQARRSLAEKVERLPELAQKREERERLAKELQDLQSRRQEIGLKGRESGLETTNVIAQVRALDAQIRKTQIDMQNVYRESMRLTQSLQESSPDAKAALADVRRRDAELESRLNALPKVVESQKKLSALKDEEAALQDQLRSLEGSRGVAVRKNSVQGDRAADAPVNVPLKGENL